MKFKLTPDQDRKIAKWIAEEVYPAAIEHQKKTVKNLDWCFTSTWEMGYPYTGAIGGALTYCFTPNSLAVVEIVKYKIGDFEMELDVTDYDHW